MDTAYFVLGGAFTLGCLAGLAFKPRVLRNLAIAAVCTLITGFVAGVALDKEILVWGFGVALMVASLYGAIMALGVYVGSRFRALYARRAGPPSSGG